MIKNFIDKNNYEYYTDISLKRYNTYRVDATTKYLVLPKNKEEFISLLKELKKDKIKYLVLGNGSNVILDFTFYDGVIILLSKLNKLEIDDTKIKVEAGYSLQKLALETTSLGLKGLEFATGIPGLVGASVAMNAGAYKSDIASLVESVTVVNKDLELVTMTKEEINFSYRNSFFKVNKDYYIVDVTLNLEHGNKEELLEKVSKRRVKRIETQPLDMPSAGSVFRNPEGMYAGELIENLGLKGYSINGATISEKHANFIVNKGKAEGKDIVKLIEKIKEDVKKEYNVDLILEQIIVK